MVKTLYVAGSFDDKGGRSSKIAKTVFEAIPASNVTYFNGGHFRELEEICERIKDFSLIYWFANVPNDKSKLISEVKKRNKACVLVTSKRNVDGNYSFQDLLYHALGNKSNLFVEITREEDKYLGRVIDSLGNVFLDHNDDFGLVGKVLGERANEVLGYTRISSESCGKKIEVPNKEEFFQIIREYADIFHGMVHANPEAANRFFGNASFRQDEQIYVSRRNIDKRHMGSQGFVGVESELPVKYFGETKPSVDTPIQIQLYSHYPSVRFMLHSHTYINDAPFTRRVMPCGALEESDEIFGLFPDNEKVNFFVNLRGHGSLALVDMVSQLRKIPYIARKTPEIHNLK